MEKNNRCVDNYPTWDDKNHAINLHQLDEHMRFCGMIAAIFTIVILLVCLFCATAGATETDIVAAVIAAEACGEGEIGMAGVASVIKNRAIKWHKTPHQIVTQKNQFYGLTAKNRDRLYSQCKSTADRLADNIMRIEDITGGAIFFRQPTEKIQKWHGTETVRIGGHIFHKDKK